MSSRFESVLLACVVFLSTSTSVSQEPKVPSSAEMNSLAWRNHNAAEAIFAEEDATSAPVTKSSFSPTQNLKPEPKTARPLLQPSQMIATFTSSRRHLVVKLPGALVRFQVDDRVSDSELEILASRLRKACIVVRGRPSTCRALSLEVDPHFFENAVALAQDRWPAASRLESLNRGAESASVSARVSPSKLWSLACAGGGGDEAGCAHAQAFAITTHSAGGTVVAKGFDSMTVPLRAKARARMPASSTPLKFERVFISRD